MAVCQLHASCGVAACELKLANCLLEGMLAGMHAGGPVRMRAGDAEKLAGGLEASAGSWRMLADRLRAGRAGELARARAGELMAGRLEERAGGRMLASELACELASGLEGGLRPAGELLLLARRRAGSR